MIVRPLYAADIWAFREQAPEMCPDWAAAEALQLTYAFSALDRNRVIAMGGVAMERPGVGTAWTILTRDWRRHARAITLACQEYIAKCPLRRIVAHVLCDVPRQHNWMHRLGFEMEAERMRAFGPGGEDFALYARVR